MRRAGPGLSAEIRYSPVDSRTNFGFGFGKSDDPGAAFEHDNEGIVASGHGPLDASIRLQVHLDRGHRHIFVVGATADPEVPEN